VEDAQPDRHVAFAAIVQEGGDEQVALFDAGAKAAHDLEGVALVPAWHGAEKSLLWAGHETQGELEVLGGNARPEGVQHLT
jgi:hypothetical protein